MATVHCVSSSRVFRCTHALQNWDATPEPGVTHIQGEPGGSASNWGKMWAVPDPPSVWTWGCGGVGAYSWCPLRHPLLSCKSEVYSFQTTFLPTMGPTADARWSHAILSQPPGSSIQLLWVQFPRSKPVLWGRDPHSHTFSEAFPDSVPQKQPEERKCWIKPGW